MQEYPENILIIGQAQKGPSQEMVLALNDNYVIDKFGARGSLVDTYR